VGQAFHIMEASRVHSDTRYDSSGRVISPLQRPLPDNTQHSQATDIHAPRRILTHNPSKRAAADPRLIPRGHWGVIINALFEVLESSARKLFFLRPVDFSNMDQTYFLFG